MHYQVQIPKEKVKTPAALLLRAVQKRWIAAEQKFPRLFPPAPGAGAVVSTLWRLHMAEPIITIRDLSNSYVHRKHNLFGKSEIEHVLNMFNLDIMKSEIFGLTGSSGCGKTTLARCILGLVDYEGKITVRGRVQMVFQDPYASLNPVKKIGWLLEEPLVIHRLGNFRERSYRVDAMLERVGLEISLKERRPHELSGGQKQRVCIGRALMLEPEILIADEAASFLDVCAGSQILNLFRELNKNLSLTILFITHNKSSAEYLCDRMAVMKNGSLLDILSY